ncbi:phage tail tape measure protein, partial [Bilophila wadsworthia]|uniref:phage tail tape measure protein n=1 Tax=Bilophila wadsworthia TaxID=35833 RepID=UPI00242A857E
MEVFSVFATLSLVDLISNPLGRVQGAMKSLGLDTSGLGARMGNLALAMTPVALAAGVMLGAFGTCVSTAAGFEDQMAKVGAVSRASAEEMVALEATARELGATTQFTAVQVGEAEQYLAMAGFTAKQNIAALPGVLNLAAATAMDLGRAADISSDILGAFGLQAEEMTRVADTLALTCATANTNMELLGDSMKYVAPVARRAGLSLEETAAMAGLLGNVGIKGSQAGTTLKTMLGKMAAPTKEAQQLFQKLGVTVKDSVGNLRNPVTVLGEMAKSLKNMGTAEQIAAMKAIVGEDAIAGFSELIEKQGIGAIEEYAKQLEAGGGSAAEMAARMNDTLAGSLRGMGSAWESVQISIGKLFIPAVRGAVDGVTVFLRLLDKATQTPFGAALLKIVSAVSMVMVSLTALSAAMWFFSAVGPMIAKALLPLKAAVLGLGAPFWALIAVVGALYLAYKSNFGGIADTLNRWWANTKLVVQGVIAVFQSLKDGSGEIRGELATKIKAAGLVGLVTTVSRIVNR